LLACPHTTGDALSNAGRIAASLGAALLCEPLPGRINRGAGLPHCRRLPYFPQEAAAELAKFDMLLLLDVRRPVAQFGYK
jgi:acetolactate synthase-1/2/3 large subunit